MNWGQTLLPMKKEAKSGRCLRMKNHADLMMLACRRVQEEAHLEEGIL